MHVGEWEQVEIRLEYFRQQDSVWLTGQYYRRYFFA